MRARKLRTIARRWWRSDAGDWEWNRVQSILQRRHDVVPDLIRALASTAPAGELSQLGPSIVEQLELHRAFSIPRPRPAQTLQLLLAARLTRDQLVEILSGTYPEYLEQMNVPEDLTALAAIAATVHGGSPTKSRGSFLRAAASRSSR